MVNGAKNWAMKAGLAGLGLAAGFTITTFLVMKIEAPTVAGLKSALSGGCESHPGTSTGYVANGGF